MVSPFAPPSTSAKGKAGTKATGAGTCALEEDAMLYVYVNALKQTLTNEDM